MTLSLRKKAALTFLPAIFLALAVIWVAAFLSARDALNGFILSDLEAAPAKALDELEDFLDDSVRDISVWAGLAIMQDVLLDDEEGEIGAELPSLAAHQGEVSALAVLNGDGRVVASTVPELQGADLSRSGAFLAARTGAMFQGQSKASTLTGAPAITLAAPIRAKYDEATIVGVLVAAIAWDQIEATLSRVLVAGVVQDRERFLVLQSVTTGEVLYPTRSQTTHGIPADATLPTEAGVSEISFAGRSYLVGTARSSAHGLLADPQWRLHALISTDVAYARIGALQRQLLIVGLVLLAVIAAFGGWGIGRMLRPIVGMIAAMQKLAAGDRGVMIPMLERSDELGQMAQTFNRMSDAIAEAESKLREASAAAEAANRAKSQFLANMSHELRTPLNSVIGFAELIEGQILGPIGDRRYVEYASDIRTSGEHLLALINDVLDFAKVEAGKLTIEEGAMDLALVVQSCLRMVKERAQHAGLMLEANIQEGTRALQGDERRIKQILLNLLTNAIKFTPAGGRVVLRSVLRPDGWCGISVQDSGIGIAPEDIPTAMEAFGQVKSDLTRYEGTGLGLPLTARLAELHGGTLSLQSEVGDGTTATLLLPPYRLLAQAA